MNWVLVKLLNNCLFLWKKPAIQAGKTRSQVGCVHLMSILHISLLIFTHIWHFLTISFTSTSKFASLILAVGHHYNITNMFTQVTPLVVILFYYVLLQRLISAKADSKAKHQSQFNNHTPIHQHTNTNTPTPIPIHQHQYTNTNTPIPIHQYQYTNTPIHQYQYTNTNTPTPIHQHTNTNTPTPIHQQEKLWWWSKKVTKIKIGFRGLKPNENHYFKQLLIIQWKETTILYVMI